MSVLLPAMIFLPMVTPAHGRPHSMSPFLEGLSHLPVSVLPNTPCCLATVLLLLTYPLVLVGVICVHISLSQKLPWLGVAGGQRNVFISDYVLAVW